MGSVDALRVERPLRRDPPPRRWGPVQPQGHLGLPVGTGDCKKRVLPAVAPVLPVCTGKHRPLGRQRPLPARPQAPQPVAQRVGAAGLRALLPPVHATIGRRTVVGTNGNTTCPPRCGARCAAPDRGNARRAPAQSCPTGENRLCGKSIRPARRPWSAAACRPARSKTLGQTQSVHGALPARPAPGCHPVPCGQTGLHRPHSAGQPQRLCPPQTSAR